MSVAVIGVAVVGAGAAAYSSYSASQTAKESENARVPKDDLLHAAAGTVPKAARYKPVDFNAAQLRAIRSNTDSLPYSVDLSQKTNAAITSDALRRITRLVPGYNAAMQKYGLAANSLLNGNLPFNDLQGIIADQSGKTGSLGIAGTAGPATFRDLGIAELQGIQTGGSILKDMVGIADQVSPTGRYDTPQTMFVSPADRIRSEMEQAQLVQNSDQNANNLEAQGDPEARLRLGLQVGGVTGYHGGDPTLGAVNAGLGSLASSASGGVGGGGGAGGGGGIASLLGGMGGAGGSSGTGGFATAGQASAAAPYAGGVGYLSGSGYVPKATYYDGNAGSYLNYYTSGSKAA